jgi:hypothetical protein
MSDRIISKPPTPEYEEAYERIFKKCALCGCKREFEDTDGLCFRCRVNAEDAFDIQREIERFGN